MVDPYINAITLDDRGRLALDISEDGEVRSYEFDLSIEDLHTLARFAVAGARHKIQESLTELKAVRALEQM